MSSKRLVGYVRVSTAKQGHSGLGIEAQKEALERFAATEGFQILRMFVEVETGKGSDALDRLSLPKIISGRSNDAIRTKLALRR
jgi:DNA invertase Pin-like site-specific DNA recombinase